jgi:trk system potassium uptake protein TrkH
MNLRAVLHFVAWPLIVIAAALAACWALSFHQGEAASVQRAFALSALVLVAGGAILLATTRKVEELGRREGIGIVTFGWLTITAAGALPYLLSGHVPRVLDAIFESVSGFTTTGASILEDPDLTPRSLLLWRALTHLFGGMGILVLCIAVLPMLGAGGMELFRAETSGIAGERLTPRIKSTAKILWGGYLGMNIALALLLRWSGLSWFDAVCHAPATIATGGFSTRTASIGAFDSVRVETILILFMLLSACSFTLHWRFLLGQWKAHLLSSEFRFFLGLWLAACLFATLVNWHSAYPSFTESVRASVFSVTSIVTTTGFCTADFDQWPMTTKLLLLLCMLVGGCAGSTAGGLKQVRLQVMAKRILRELRLFVYRNAVIPVKQNGKPVAPSVVSQIAVYFSLYLLTFLFAALLVSHYVDLETALSSVAACMGGVGPGLGLAGATEPYTAFAAPAKAVLIFCMLLGRLEFYTLLIVLFPHFWRK